MSQAMQGLGVTLREGEVLRGRGALELNKGQTPLLAALWPLSPYFLQPVLQTHHENNRVMEEPERNFWPVQQKDREGPLSSSPLPTHPTPAPLPP